MFVALSGQKPLYSTISLALYSGDRYQKYMDAKGTRDLRCIRSVDVQRLALSRAPFFFHVAVLPTDPISRSKCKISIWHPWSTVNNTLAGRIFEAYLRLG